MLFIFSLCDLTSLIIDFTIDFILNGIQKNFVERRAPLFQCYRTPRHQQFPSPPLLFGLQEPAPHEASAKEMEESSYM